MTLEEQLKDFRLFKGLRQWQITEKTGIPQNYISEYETGKRKVSIKIVRKFNEAFGTDFKLYRKCTTCEIEFVPENPHDRKCKDCKKKTKYRQAHYNSVPLKEPALKPKPKVPLSEFAELAQKRGLTYGQLQAEELKRKMSMQRRVKDA